MIDARGQIRELLESIDHDRLKVKMSYPSGYKTMVEGQGGSVEG